MVLDGTGSVYDDTHYKLVLLGIRWYMVRQRACMPVYIGKKWRFGRMLPMPDIRQTTEYRATQLVYSIKFKLIHAIILKTLFSSFIKSAVRNLFNNFFSPPVLNCEPSDGQYFKDSSEGMGRVSLAQDDTGLVRKVSESIVIRYKY